MEAKGDLGSVLLWKPRETGVSGGIPVVSLLKVPEAQSKMRTKN